MSFEVDASRRFLKELKQLKKRYASILEDVEELGAALSEDPIKGHRLVEAATRSAWPSAPKAKARAEVHG